MARLELRFGRDRRRSVFVGGHIASLGSVTEEDNLDSQIITMRKLVSVGIVDEGTCDSLTDICANMAQEGSTRHVASRCSYPLMRCGQDALQRSCPRPRIAGSLRPRRPIAAV